MRHIQNDKKGKHPMSDTTMRILSQKGIVEVDLPDAYDRSVVGGHWNAIGIYTRSGHADRLYDYYGLEVGDGILLETDPAKVEEWWFAGELDFLEVYTS